MRRSYNTPKHTYINGKKVPYKSQEYRDYQKKHRDKLRKRNRCYCGAWPEPDHSHCRTCIDRVGDYKRRRRAGPDA